MRDPRQYSPGGILRGRAGQPGSGGVLRQRVGAEEDEDTSALALQIRDTVGDDTPDERVLQADQALRAQGKSAPERKQMYIDKAKEYALGSYSQRSQQIRQQYADEAEKARALANEESTAQKILAALGNFASGVSGGSPTALSDTFAQQRQQRSDSALDAAREKLDVGLQGLDDDYRDQQRGREDLLFEQGQEDRTRGLDSVEARAQQIRQLAAQIGIQVPEGGPPEAVIQTYEPIVRGALKPQKPGFNEDEYRRKKQIDQEYAPAPSQGKPLPGAVARDREAGKAMYDWVTKDRSDASRSIAELDNAIARLGESDNLTGPIAGSLPDSVSAMVNPDAVDVREQVENIVQRSLRATLGAQFTEREGERLIARAYNPRLDEATNQRRLRSLVGQLKESIVDRDRAARYFEENQTLEGFVPRYRTVDDFRFEGDESAPPSRGTGAGAEAAEARATAGVSDSGGMIEVTNGTETLRIYPEDLAEAEADGFQRAR